MAAHVTALEGVVVDGRIRLPAGVRLPERAKVYVLIPEVEAIPTAYIASPRLADPAQSTDFEMQVREGAPDASV